MPKILKINKSSPYDLLYKYLDQAIIAKQHSIDAISISSFNKITNEVNSRFVNLKFIDDRDFIFFSNYNSMKAVEFESHSQISALIYWGSINIQIRMQANIKKTPTNFSNQYFAERSKEKNALAISSNQSKKIESYEDVKKSYSSALHFSDLKKRPDYWGGYSFTPYSFEFWEGHESRLNIRNVYELKEGDWSNFLLEP